MSVNPDVRDTSRRRLLKTLAVSCGAIGTAAVLPETWTKPVVDAVVVPLHAQTSPVLNPSALAGAWVGQWNNVTFGSTGAARATVTVDAQAQTFVVVLDLDGNVFGGSNPPPDTFYGTYTSESGTFGGVSPTLGTVSMTITKNGVVSGSFTNIPNAGLKDEKLTGALTPQTYTVNFTITFTDNSTATGVTNMTKQ